MIDSLAGSYQKITFPTMRNFCLPFNLLNKKTLTMQKIEGCRGGLLELIVNAIQNASLKG